MRRHCGIIAFIRLLFYRSVINHMKKVRNFLQIPTVRTSAALLLSFAGGFIFSDSAVAGVASFADISLAGALSLPFSSAVLIGALIHGLSADSVGKGIVKLTAMTFLIIVKLFTGTKISPIYRGLTTTAAVLFSGAAISALIGELPQKILFYAFYALLAGFTAFSGTELLKSCSEERVISFRGKNGVYYAVIYIVYIASLFSFQLPAINVGFVIGGAVTLLAAYNYGCMGGIALGGLTAFAAYLVSAKAGMSSAVLPAAGLFTGTLKKRSIPLSAAVFAMICYAMSVLTASARDGIDITLSVVCTAGIFIIAAPNWSDKWLDTSADFSPLPEYNRLKMNFLSSVIDTVRTDAGRISAALWESEKRTPSAAGSVCGKCARNVVCERADFEASDELIPDIPERCVKKSELSHEFQHRLIEQTAAQLMKLRCSKERKLLNEQLMLTAEILRDSVQTRNIRQSPEMSLKITSLLQSHDITADCVYAYYNSANRLIAEIYFGSGKIPANSSRVCDIVSDELGISLREASSAAASDDYRISLYEPPEYSIEVYSAAVCANGSEVSGDSTVLFTDSEGISYAALSDGMGTGKSAAVDSHMVIGLFRRLISGGMECTSAVKLINSVMVSKSREESFATFDAVRFDPDTASLTSVKSGAAATLIRQNNSVIKVSAPTFPIGINESVEVSTCDFQLGDNDIVIMFSDGICENEYLFIKELLLSSDNIEDIVRETAVKASTFAHSPHNDDVTVIGIKIINNS